MSSKFTILLVALSLVGLFFWKSLLFGQVPFPADFVIGIYYPWLDYKWGYETGVPVKNTVVGDVPSFSYPMRMLGIELLKKGQLPLWNPYILAGTPLLANFQSAAFSPTNFVYFLFDRATGWTIQIILQHILAIFFSYILLRSWGLGRLSSVTGGLIFSFSGFNLIWSQWNSLTLVASFIPLILYFGDKLFLTGRFIFGAGLSFAISLLLVSGYPQLIFYSLVSLLVLYLVRTKSFLKESPKWFYLFIFLALGFGLASFQIFPGIELFGLSVRRMEDIPYDLAFVSWKKIITIFAPDYYGNPVTRNYWGPQDYLSNLVFVGVVASTLASLAIFYFRKKEEVKYSLYLLIASLLLTFPSPISTFIWRESLFGLGAASQNRGAVLFCLSVGFLAAYGIEYLTRFYKRRNSKFRYKLSLLFTFVILTSYLVYTSLLFIMSKRLPGQDILLSEVDKYLVGLRNLILPISLFVFVCLMLVLFARKIRYRKLFSGLIIFALTFELYRFGWKFTPFSSRELVFPTTPILEFLRKQEKPFRVTGSSVIPVNMKMPYNLESPEGYEAIYPSRIAKFISVINSGDKNSNPQLRHLTIDNETSTLLDLVNTKYFLTVKINEKGQRDASGQIPPRFSKERFVKVFEDKSVVVLESKTSLPRAFMVYDWERVEGEGEILDRLLDPTFPFDKKIVIENFDQPPKRIAKDNFKVSYKKYEAAESLIEVETPEHGLLFVSDTWYPGWKVFVDGEEEKIYRADFAFRAIFVPKGVHEIRMIYEPKSFFDGLKISAISLLILGGVVTHAIGKRSRGSYT